MTRSWHFEIPEEGALHLNMQCHMEPVVDQDEVETQLVPDTKRRRTELADQAARCDSNANFAQFAELYKQWRTGLLLDQQVVNKYGAELLAYFEAQFAMGGEISSTSPQGIGDGCSLQPLESHGYLPMSRYETVYALWRDGWVGDRQVQDALGPRILEAMARQQLSGDLGRGSTS